MNEKLPYEHRLADKLNQLPVPDADASWDKMRTMLDRELPPVGGGGGDDGRMPGGRWWGFGVTIGVILLATWFAFHQGWLGDGSIRAGTAANSTPTHQKNTNANSNQQQPNEKNLLEENQNKKTKTNNNSQKNKVADAANEVNPGNPSSTGGTPDANQPAVANPDNINPNSTGEKNVASSKGNSKTSGVKSFAVAGSKNSANPTAPNANRGSGSKSNKIKSNNSNASYLAAARAGKSNNTPGQNGKGVKPGTQTVTKGKKTYTLSELDELPMVYSFDINRSLKRVKASSIARMPGDQPEHEPKDKSQIGKGFVFGLSFYQNFAISSNLSFGYNADAKKSLMMDYLPSIYGQYHINPKMYVQAELQFNMPQATPELLMYSGYRQQNVSGMSFDVQRNIYLRKLYYFNIPMNFYYSPAKNFWLGAGLQFSSLNSGLVTVEDHYTPVSSGDPYTKSIVSKIKKDSLTDKLSKTEFRLMLDLNYNWRWLTVGLRLNQALKDYINLNYYSAPPAQDKNESLQLYLRFNLWDGRNRPVGNAISKPAPKP